MVAIIDYGVGNLFSLCASFKAIGKEAVVTNDKKIIESADQIILPGVGAFSDAAKKLRESGLDEIVLNEKNKPVMGICLGMQLLFDKSFEYGEHEGLGIIKGEVVPFELENLKVPHMGWNPLKIKQESPLFKYVKEGDCVYFVHSYHAINCDENTLATVEYGTSVTAAVQKGNIFGCQFHPEKSGEVGLSILRAFCEMEALK